jgi:hypothetical protein
MLPLSFFGRKELQAYKMIIIITHTVKSDSKQPTMDSIQKTRGKGGKTSRKKGEEVSLSSMPLKAILLEIHAHP